MTPTADEAQAPVAEVNVEAAAAAGVPAAPAEDVIAAQPAATVEGKDWSKGALIIVGNHSIPSGEKRPVIIVEEWSDVKLDDDGEMLADGAPVLKVDKYPTKGDLYFRTDLAVVFPDGAEVLTLGDNVQQLALWGFSPDIRHVCVGPGCPAFAAANAAYSRGARDIEIVGLSADQQARAKLYFDDIPTNKVIPAPDVKITFS